MCIIAIKPKNKDIQDKKTLETCFSSNRDGAGYMFVNNRMEVVIKKGFMKFDDFYKSVMEDYEKYDLKNKNLVMHFRIGTSGKSATGCTHPFVISTNYDDLERVKSKTSLGVCHNGIISGFNDRAAQYSDTEKYIVNVIAPILKLNEYAYTRKDILNLFALTTGSKLAFLDKFDDVYLVGNFVEDNGYKYSNTTYKPVVYTSKYYGYDYYDDYYESEWFKSYQKTKNTIKPNQNSKVYKALLKGNVFICDEIEYWEVDTSCEYYFDKDYNIYEYDIKSKEWNVVGTNAIIYKDNTMQQRVDFNDR